MAKEDPKYIEWIKQQHCSVAYCRGRTIEAHHRNQERYSQRRVSDFETMPLCTSHHRELHQRGWPEFNYKHNYDQHAQVKIWLVKYIQFLRDYDNLPF